MTDEKAKGMGPEEITYGGSLQAVIDAYKPGIDRTLIRRNLSLTVDERFEQLMSLQRFAEELRAAGKRASQRECPNCKQYLKSKTADDGHTKH